MSFDAKNFRRALSQFPTGVTVITTIDNEGKPIGVTASSFNTVSVEPPLILWSIDKSAFSLEAFQKGEHFVVNVLGRDQVAMSNRFAGRGEDKFAGVSYKKGLGDSPVFEGNAAVFECKTWAVYEGGDHLILVGEVMDYQYDDAKSPLVFSRGSYAITAVHPDTPQKSTETDESSDMEEFFDDYTLYLLRETYNLYSQELYPELKEKYGVNPEEWRVLACLSGDNKMSIRALASLVMQPENTLVETLEWMSDKGFLVANDLNEIHLTDEGKTLSQELVCLAKDHDKQILSSLSKEQSETLKEGLRVLLDSSKQS